MWIIIMFFIVGIILDAITLFYLIRHLLLIKNKVKTIGEIVDFKSTKSETERLYYPVLSFSDQSGEPIKAQSFYGTNPPMGEVGDKIKIYYDVNNPERFDFSFRMINWGFIYIFGLVGTAFLAFGILTLIYMQQG